MVLKGMAFNHNAFFLVRIEDMVGFESQPQEETGSSCPETVPWNSLLNSHHFIMTHSYLWFKRISIIPRGFRIESGGGRSTIGAVGQARKICS
jgi:hypothetical protein